MPFENFYKESDAARRRWWKFFGLAFLLFTGYWTFALLTMPDFEGDRKAAEYLNNIERVRRADDPPQMNHTLQTDQTSLTRVNELCTNLPRPEKFEFISSHENSGFASTTIIYSYTSPRGAEEIMPVFLVWLNENGWHRIPNTSTFEKENQTVYISPSTILNAPWTNYEIYCTEKD